MATHHNTVHDFNRKLRVGTFANYEMQHMSELMRAYFSIVNTANWEIVNEAQSAAQVLNIEGLNIRQTVRFCKGLTFFRDLKQCDQIMVIKSFCPVKFALQAAFRYYPQEDGFAVFLHGAEQRAIFARMHLFKHPLLANESHWTIFRNFVRLLHSELQQDQAIQKLVKFQVFNFQIAMFNALFCKPRFWRNIYSASGLQYWTAESTWHTVSRCTAIY